MGEMSISPFPDSCLAHKTGSVPCLKSIGQEVYTLLSLSLGAAFLFGRTEKEIFVCVEPRILLIIFLWGLICPKALGALCV